MKNKKVLIFLIILVVVLISFIFMLSLTADYKVFVVNIDEYSPDRKLVVKKNNKEIEFKSIKYLDGIELCSGKNPTVSVSDIKDEKELIIVLQNEKEVTAIIEE